METKTTGPYMLHPDIKRSLCCGGQFSAMVTRKIPTLWTVTACGENSVVMTVTLQYVYWGVG